MKRWFTRGINLDFQLVMIGVLLLSLAACFSQWSFYLDLVSHFRQQYLLVGIIPLVFFGLRRNWRWLGVGAIVVLLNAGMILPWHFPVSPPSVAASPSLRVLMINVNVRNRNEAATLKLIEAEKPDVLVVIETNQRWIQALNRFRDRLPHQALSRGAAGFGSALYSRLPLQQEPIADPANTISTNSRIDVRFSHAGNPIHLIAIHPPPPIRKALFVERNRELQTIARQVRAETPTIVLGDFNTTLWSAFYQTFERESQLTSTRRGFGVLPTWAAQLPPLLRIPIDHVLVSSHFRVVAMRTRRAEGADHLGVIVDLAIQEPQNRNDS